MFRVYESLTTAESRVTLAIDKRVRENMSIGIVPISEDTLDEG